MQPNNVSNNIANNIIQYGFGMNHNLVAAEPILLDYVDDGHGSTGALVHIGFLDGEPVYRTTHTVAHYMEGDGPGEYEIHWPPLFPNVWIAECELLQLDVTIRPEPAPYEPYGGGDDDDDDCYDCEDDCYGSDNYNDYDADYDFADDIVYEEELEATISSLDNIDLEWVNIIDDSHQN